eukprot:5894557-Lingulodinium_polyedra.AAC.2
MVVHWSGKRQDEEEVEVKHSTAKGRQWLVVWHPPRGLTNASNASSCRAGSQRSSRRLPSSS